MLSTDGYLLPPQGWPHRQHGAILSKALGVREPQKEGAPFLAEAPQGNSKLLEFDFSHENQLTGPE